MGNLKIFNSEKEAKGLEGALVESLKIRDGNDPLEKLFYFFQGKFTLMQRLKSVINEKSKELGTNYAIITDKYETIINNSGYLQNFEDCDKFLTIKVNFYKQKIIK